MKRLADHSGVVVEDPSTPTDPRPIREHRRQGWAASRAARVYSSPAIMRYVGAVAGKKIRGTVAPMLLHRTNWKRRDQC